MTDFSVPECEKDCGHGTAHKPACDERWKAYWRTSRNIKVKE